MPCRIPKVFFSALVAILAVTASFAAKPAAEPTDIGSPNISASAVQWTPSGSYGAVILTVSGPNDFIMKREFAAGTQPMLRLQDLGKGLSADGLYIWELRYVPRISPEVRRQLAAAREADDDAAAERIQEENGLSQTLVRSGAVTVLNGSFVTGGEETPAPGERKIVTNAPSLKPAPNDQVIADDLIVQGSACVGLDCVNNESFGFDTIRLKENNTRIKFDDTSTAAGFPANDWQLTANDSASGGANKFSIEDITGAKVPFTLTAGAATNSIFVDSIGRVGFRTSTPVLDLHVNTSNTPALRLEQNSGGGFSAQTWDIAGNEANFFVRDVTGGSRLPFRIRPGAPTSSIDIAANGNVGIGMVNPPYGKLGVKGNAWIEGPGTDSAVRIAPGILGTSNLIDSNYSATGGYLPLRISANAGVYPNQLYLSQYGNIGIGTASPANPIQHSSGAVLTAGGVWQNASSRATKEDICELDSDAAREAFFKLDPVTFVYKIDPQEHHVGFIAEDVPDLVSTKDRKSLSPMDIVAVLTKVVQDQQRTIEDLQKRLQALEKKNP